MPISNLKSLTNHPSTVNSSFSPLKAGEIFVGEWEDVFFYSHLYCLCRTDVPGNMIFEYSIDGVEVDRSFAVVVTGGPDATFSGSGPRCRYFRMRYINDNIDQTVFRLHTTYSPFESEVGIAPISQGLSSRSNSRASRSLSFGIKPDNTYSPLQLDGNNRLCVTPNGSFESVTHRLVTEAPTADQIVLSHLATKTALISHLGIFVLAGGISSAVTFYGDFKLKVGGRTVYDGFLTSMTGGVFTAGLPGIPVSSGEIVTVSCSPSPPFEKQTWVANIVL